MGLADNVKSQIDTQIISSTTGLGSTLTLTREVESVDAYGEPSRDEWESSTIDAVPFNNVKSLKRLESLGQLNEGEIRLVIKSDESFTDSPEDYKYTWQGNDYRLVQINDIPMQDVILVKILTLRQDVF